MSEQPQYTPGPAGGARIEKDGERWTLVLVRELRHAPERVWAAITDPAELREWAPYEIEGNLGMVGAVQLKWVGAPAAQQVQVTRVDPPRVLEYGDMRWQLEPSGTGTTLTLWTVIDRRYISMGAAGWHVAFDVLERKLAGQPMPKIVGPAAMQNPGWQRLNAEYAKLFGVELPKW